MRSKSVLNKSLSSGRHEISSANFGFRTEEYPEGISRRGNGTLAERTRARDGMEFFNAL